MTPGSGELRFLQVDAFTSVAFSGNPAVVVLDAGRLDGPGMLAIAREFHVSETAFVLSPTTPRADYRLRFFTPRREVPFCGHGTIAAAHALWETPEGSAAERVARVQECGIGLVAVQVSQDADGSRWYWMEQAPPVFREILGLARRSLASIGLGRSPSQPLVVSTGLPWLLVEVASERELARLQPDLKSIEALGRSLDVTGLVAFWSRLEHGRLRVGVRTFAPGEGVPEDPVCGSGQGAVGAYLARTLFDGTQGFDYVGHQGREVGRPGEVRVRCLRRGGTWCVRVGGCAVTVARGDIAPPLVPTRCPPT